MSVVHCVLQLALLCEEFSRQPPGTSYPDYYTVPFHAYDEGNLNWLAAYEVEPASYAMALRTFKGEGLTASEAMERLRGNINEQMQVRPRTAKSAGSVCTVTFVQCIRGSTPPPCCIQLQHALLP